MTITKHRIEQKAPGKYDCHYDSWIHGEYATEFSSDDEFGDVNDYGMWNGRVTITAESRDEREAIGHYGGPFLIIQEDGQGFVTIGSYDDEAQRDAEFQRLSELYFAWADAEDEED